MSEDTKLDEARHAFRSAEIRQLAHSTKLIEGTLDLWDRQVSFEDELFDASTGMQWNRIGAGRYPNGAAAAAYQTEADLDRIRKQGRYFADQNPFAISGQENRINYVVGSGHQYVVTPKPGMDPTPELIESVKKVVDAFVKLNKWGPRQQENLGRFDRDGEVFLRFFPDATTGELKVRYVEPEFVRTPNDKQNTPGLSFGIQTDPDDVEEVEAYWVLPNCKSETPESIPANQIQHRKANVDSTAPRGIPLFYPVRANLREAVNILRNLARTSAMQSAIAMIRKHSTATKEKVQRFVDTVADVKITNETTGKSRTITDYPPAAILDTGSSIDYEFPSAGIDIEKHVAGVQAQLRAIASRLVMPEFMLTSDASNANYASTMVAEGPAAKQFGRLQARMVEDDLEVIELAVQTAMDAGDLPADTLEQVQIQGQGPRIETRDRLKDAQADNILSTAGIMSDQTYSGRHELDYEKEQNNIEQAQERETGFPGPGDENSGDDNPANDPEDDDPVSSSSGQE
jgi:hypothetical protein